jgi:hypothetical protein
MSRRVLLALATPVVLAALLLALSGSGVPESVPTVDPLPPALMRLATAVDTEWSGGWPAATSRGNRGRGIAIALIDPTFPDGLHVRQMHDLIGETVPDVSVYRAATDPAEVYRLCQPPIGCSVVCCPWTLPQTFSPPAVRAWMAAFEWAANNGVLVFVAAGNNEDPILSPHAVACAAVNAGGRYETLGSPPTGRIDACVYVGGLGSSGASCRVGAIAAQWLSAGGVYLFGQPAARLPGFREWLRLSGRRHPSGRGVVPLAGSL